MKKLVKKSAFIFTIAFLLIIVMWIGNVNADPYIVDKKLELFQRTRQLVGLFVLSVMIGSFILALFKKISWWWLFSFFSWLSGTACSGLAVDYISGLEYTKIETTDIVTLLFFLLFFLLFLLPLIIAFVQYRKKKDKNLTKHRLYIWLTCGLSIPLCTGLAYLL